MNIEEQQAKVDQLKASAQQLVMNHYAMMGRIAEAEECLSKLKEEAAQSEVKKSLESSNDEPDSSADSAEA